MTLSKKTFHQKYPSHWKEIWITANEMHHNLNYVVGVASNFSLYLDPWCDGFSLLEISGADCFNIFGKPKNALLSYIMNENHWCLLNSLKILNLHYFNFILKIIPSSGGEYILWKDSTINSKLVLNPKI